MTDPSDALKSFQQMLLLGRIQMQPGEIDPEIWVHLDHPNGEARFTYVRLDRQTVTAFVNLVLCDPVDGTPCFQIGYAVPEAYRSHGLAKSAVSAAITEMKHGLAQNKISAFYVEAIVGADNEASKLVAAAIISTSPVTIVDQVSGLPAFQYIRKVVEGMVG